MTCYALEGSERKPLLSSRLISGLVSGLGALMRPRYPRLDAGTVSDHMKRDMGFIDWGAPRREDSPEWERPATGPF